jgi:hypothetical protein
MGEIDYSKFEPAFQPKAEQVPTEPPAEPVVQPQAEPTAPPAEPTVATPEPPQATPQETLNYEFFNKTFKTDFKTEDDLRKVIELSSKAKTLEDRVKDYDELQQKLEAYKESQDILKYFKSEDDYRAQQYLKNNPDKDATVAARLFTSDVSKLSDLDILTQFELLDGTLGDEAKMRSDIAEKYAIDLEADPKEWSALAKSQLRRDANKARAEIKAMKEGIALPERVDVESKRKQAQEDANARAEQLQKGWSTEVPKLLADLKSVEVIDYDKDNKAESIFTYAVADEDKKQMGEDIMGYLISSGKEINDNNIKEAAGTIRGWYVLNNLPKMFKAFKSELAAVIDEQKDKETHNPNPVKTDIKPPDDAETKRRQDETAYALGQSGFTPNLPSWMTAKKG